MDPFCLWLSIFHVCNKAKKKHLDPNVNKCVALLNEVNNFPKELLLKDVLPKIYFM